VFDLQVLDEYPTILFSHQPMDREKFENLFSIPSPQNRTAKVHAVVVHVGEDNGLV
jgi:hypothetical protein